MEYLTTAEVAERYRTVQSTVRHWRHIGYGPKGALVGRRVLYPRHEVEAFDKERGLIAADSADAA